ncbi:MAG: hypothetical protein KJN63_08855, partial [Acidimicrobiia bacterium]|nr:hypothetical protein [Acidimicrobiia bacterium]
MRSRWNGRAALLGTYVLLIAGMVAIVPGFGGSPDEPTEAGASEDPPTVTLDGTSVEYRLTPEATATQELSNGQGCTLATGANLLAFSGSKTVGFAGGSIGIKSKGNGQD